MVDLMAVDLVQALQKAGYTDVSMLNLLACLTRSGTGAGALAGRVLGDQRAVAGITGTTTEMPSGRGET